MSENDIQGGKDSEVVSLLEYHERASVTKIESVIISSDHFDYFQVSLIYTVYD